MTDNDALGVLNVDNLRRDLDAAYGLEHRDKDQQDALHVENERLRKAITNAAGVFDAEIAECDETLAGYHAKGLHSWPIAHVRRVLSRARDLLPEVC